MNKDTLNHRRTKRTTVTLEADIADYIQETIAKNKGLKEKELINRLLRFGIKTESVKSPASFKIRGFKSKFQTGFDPENIERLLDEV